MALLLDLDPHRARRPRDDAAGVVDKFEVRATQIIDYLALVGDSSDNIPGVPKVGPKTAVALLAEFEGVDDILENIDIVLKKFINIDDRHTGIGLASQQSGPVLNGQAGFVGIGGPRLLSVHQKMVTFVFGFAAQTCQIRSSAWFAITLAPTYFTAGDLG